MTNDDAVVQAARPLKALARDTEIPDEIWVGRPVLRYPNGSEHGSWATVPDDNAKVRYVRAALAAMPAGELVTWRCFHCDETFSDKRAAQDHFGCDETSEPACRIKAGAERSLLGALRRAEKDAADAWMAVQTETTDAAKAYYKQATRHHEQLRIVEEAGYERGMEDARAALATTQPRAAAGASFEFDRYINGTLMAEGVTIERQNNLPDAMREAARIASRGPNGEPAVLIYRGATPPAPADALNLHDAYAIEKAKKVPPSQPGEAQ